MAKYIGRQWIKIIGWTGTRVLESSMQWTPDKFFSLARPQPQDCYLGDLCPGIIKRQSKLESLFLYPGRTRFQGWFKRQKLTPEKKAEPTFQNLNKSKDLVSGQVQAHGWVWGTQWGPAGPVSSEHNPQAPRLHRSRGNVSRGRVLSRYQPENVSSSDLRVIRLCSAGESRGSGLKVPNLFLRNSHEVSGRGNTAPGMTSALWQQESKPVLCFLGSLMAPSTLDL